MQWNVWGCGVGKYVKVCGSAASLPAGSSVSGAGAERAWHWRVCKFEYVMIVGSMSASAVQSLIIKDLLCRSYSDTKNTD